MYQLVIVVPCYNEEAVLEETNRRLLALAGRLEGMEVATHILYVDDGSADATWRLISDFAEKTQTVQGLKLAHNEGHQHALWAGLEKAVETADAVVSIDADLQDSVDAIVEMVEQHRGGCDIVFGVRRKRHTDSFFKRVSAQMFYRLMQSLGAEVVYNHADFRLMSRRAVKALLQYPERNLFIRGMVKTLGYRQGFVYYDRTERMAGESKYPLSKMLAFAWDGITSFSVRPLRLIMGVGLFCIFISFVAIVWALVTYLQHRALPGWTSMLVSVWFLGGAVLTALGIIGEYVGKIYSEVKRRPRYIVEEEVGF
ncbi:MAG: glycosyltransferase family 2 protein [Alloprevotella sp.]